MKSSELRGTPAHYFKSLNRYFNVLGVDRALFFLIVGLSMPIAVSGKLSLTVDLLAAGVFMVLYVLGVLITRADNQILLIYKRHIHYKKYYAPHPGVHAKVPMIKPSVPFYQGKGGLV